MHNPLAQEIARQLLRGLVVALGYLGLPPPIAALLEHPEVVSWVTGVIIYLAVELWWAWGKLKDNIKRKVANG